jgi:hypothetical protein
METVLENCVSHDKSLVSFDAVEIVSIAEDRLAVPLVVLWLQWKSSLHLLIRVIALLASIEAPTGHLV